jgi:chromosome partitioning protein
MILTLAGIKGGCGKSLISSNLTVIRSLQNKRVLLIDADEQHTVFDWTNQRISLGINTPWSTIRLSGKSLGAEVLKMKDKFDDIIIDCAGRDSISLRSSLLVSDVSLTPFQPKSFDIWTISQISSLIEEAKIVNPKLKSYTFINCAKPRGEDNNEAQEILKESASELTLLPATIGLRQAFSNATSQGLGVVELKVSDAKASSEMQYLHDMIYIEL